MQAPPSGTARLTLPLHAFLAPFRGLTQTFTPGLRSLVVIPLLINVILVVALVTVAAMGFDALLSAWLPTAWDWLAWLFWPLFALLWLLVIGITAVALAAIIASPFSGPLAYRSATKSGHLPQAPPRSLSAELGHALITAIRKLIHYGLLLIPVLLVTFIPGLNLFAPLAWFAYGSWVLAVEFLEVPLANDGRTFSEVRQTLGRHRLTTLAFGAGTTLIAMIPIANLLLVPAAVIGGTHLYVRMAPSFELHPRSSRTQADGGTGSKR